MDSETKSTIKLYIKLLHQLSLDYIALAERDGVKLDHKTWPDFLHYVLSVIEKTEEIRGSPIHTAGPDAWH